MPYLQKLNILTMVQLTSADDESVTIVNRAIGLSEVRLQVHVVQVSKI
jgi:hypothetical protein